MPGDRLGLDRLGAAQLEDSADVQGHLLLIYPFHAGMIEECRNGVGLLDICLFRHLKLEQMDGWVPIGQGVINDLFHRASTDRHVWQIIATKIEG